MLIDCSRRTCIIRDHGTRCEIYPPAMVAGKALPTDNAEEQSLTSPLQQNAESQTAWSLCSPKQASKLLRTTGTKYIMVNVRESKQSNPISLANISHPQRDTGGDGQKQVGGSHHPQRCTVRPDANARGHGPSPDLGQPSTRPTKLAKGNPGGAVRHHIPKPSVPTRDCVGASDQRPSTQKQNSANVPDSTSRENAVIAAAEATCLGQTQQEQDPDTTPLM